MIRKVEIITETTLDVNFVFNQGKVILKNDLIIEDPFALKITFEEPIAFVRNHDYNWSLPYENFCANIFAPKMIKLKNGYVVQSNLMKGSWRLEKKGKNVLYWFFNQKYQRPIVQYKGISNIREVEDFKESVRVNQLSLLISNYNGLEFSRSQIPFSGVICFTDHCDFDTLLSLKTLRAFFKSLNIKTTKGFFLNHYSKRIDNASYENDKNELSSWLADGHEMAYHSLTQSLRDFNEATKEFENFTPVFSSSTWIDHGYQPYNLSLTNYLSGEYHEKIGNLNKKGINNYWNYIDSGYATDGVINQMNPNHFTLGAYRNGIKSYSIKKRFGLGIKNLIFHYTGNEKQIDNYKKLVSIFKKGIKHVFLKKSFDFVRHFLVLINEMIGVIYNWKDAKKNIYPLALYTPTIFKVTDTSFIFQTLEMTDFEKGLSSNNIDILIRESGLSILHTYFSVQLSYHEGRVMQDEQTINSRVLSNFKNLSHRINNGDLWNPTLEELLEYLQGYFDLELDIGKNGEIYEVSNSCLISRLVKV